MIQNGDLATIEKQLGRKPRGLLDIVHRDQSGVPVVLLINPLVENKPFPTLYWLSHKKIHESISKIEQTGWIKYLENDLIANSPEIQTRLLKDAKDYKLQRWKVFQKYNSMDNVSHKFKETIQSTGIGGLQDDLRVRCLHMHYAHFLIGSNIIGELLVKEFKEITSLN